MAGKRMMYLMIVSAGLFLWLAPAFGAPTIVTYFQVGAIYEYRIKLLELTLAKTAGEGEIVVQPIAGEVSQARGLTMLGNNDVDIAFLGTNAARETKYLPIKIDILSGILGYRVFLINKDSQKTFDDVKTMTDLLKLKAGFGAQWGDIEILKANNIPVVGVALTHNLIRMLESKRFDYFPRGINEAWVELAANKAKVPSLAVEQSVALFYPYPVYFFVNKGNTVLATRIEKGLNIALKDGSFKALFLQYHKDLLTRADLKNRELFQLTNPTLPAGTPDVDTSWWRAGRLPAH